MTRIEALTREAAALPKTERLELVRVLLDLDVGAVAEAEEAWDEEIRARVKAVDEGRATSVSLEDLRREMAAGSASAVLVDAGGQDGRMLAR
ncbi:MAG TPA: addiction module protein [Opitutaceae bacterium]|nr:addiction module protein [Opitutaceae bacterium]